MDWGVAEAKQQLSKVLREARKGPQIIRTRGTIVGAVLGPSDAEAYLTWRQARRPRPSLAELTAEARLIAIEEGFDGIPVEPRTNRPNAMLAPKRATRRVKGAGRHERSV